MNIDSSVVGANIHGRKHSVTWRQTTNYAAAVGDANRLYLDDTSDQSLIAPPCYVTALTWPISETMPQRLEAQVSPELFLTQVHYSETMIFHRPIRPGDELTISGKALAVLPHRAGTHVVARYDGTDAKGEAVFSEYSGVMLRGVKCTDDGAGAEDMPDIPVTPDKPGEPVWGSKMHIDPLMPYIYDGCTDIVFAIHTSPKFATGVGLPGIILQGTATLALAAKELVDRVADGDTARLKQLSCRFSGMVLPGSDIDIRLTARNGDDNFFEVLNDQGKAAISRGHALIV